MTNSDEQGGSIGSGIVGKSVEEIEAESGNAHNSPVAGEQRRDDQARAVPAVPLGVAGGGVGGAGTFGTGQVVPIPAIAAVEGLVDHSGEAADGRTGVQRDSSEE